MIVFIITFDHQLKLTVTGHHTNNGQKMKTIKNYIQGNEAGKVVGQLINAIAFICGLAVIVIGITAQLLKYFYGFNLFTDLF